MLLERDREREICCWICQKIYTLTFDFQGSKAYVKAIQKVGLVTEDECKLILSGLEKVSYFFFLSKHLSWNE